MTKFSESFKTLGANEKSTVIYDIQEMVECLKRIQSERELMKNYLDNCSEVSGIPKKLIRKTARFVFKKDGNVVFDEINQSLAIAEEVLGVKTEN